MGKQSGSLSLKKTFSKPKHWSMSNLLGSWAVGRKTVNRTNLEGLLVGELCAQCAHVGVDVAAVQAVLGRHGRLLCAKLHHGQQRDPLEDDNPEHLQT